METFYSQGGSAVASAVVAQNSYISKPDGSTQDVYTFTGWYLDSARSFVDMAADTYYANVVICAVINGITNGTCINSFRLEGAVFRSQVISFLYPEQKESPNP